MTIKVYHASNNSTKSYSGSPEQVLEQLMATYTFLKRYPTHSLACALKNLSRQQNYFVEIEE